jgi:hypothetical protein
LKVQQDSGDPNKKVLAAKSISLESCSEDTPDEFKKLHEATFQYRDGTLQVERHSMEPSLGMRYLKLIIHDGWDVFAAVSKCDTPQFATRLQQSA